MKLFNIKKSKKNKNQFFDNRNEIADWLDNNYVKNYIINDDLSVDVNDDVGIAYKNLKIIPVKFGKVTGSFLCNYNELTSLIGSPKFVGGNFWCSDNKLISLIVGPEYVGGGFYCQKNKLRNLNWIAINIAGDLKCDENCFVDLTDFSKINIGKEITLTLDKKIFKDKELYNFLNKYFNKENNRVEIEFKILKSYFEKFKLEKNLKVPENIKSKKIIKNSYL